MRIAVIDGSFDGLMSVVYARYYEKLDPTDIVEQEMFQQRLDADYIFIESDSEKSQRVFDALRKISREAAEDIWYAFTVTNAGRFMDIFKYMLLVFSKGSRAHDYLKLDYVRNVKQMRRYAGMEAHRMIEFARFSQTKSGVLYSEIGPECDVLYMVALHFTERLISEAWVIHDVKRKKAAIYDAKELAIANTGGQAEVELCSDEEQFQELWTQFVDNIAIKERINPRLQRQFLPMRYRQYMTEFAIKKQGKCEPAHLPCTKVYSSLGAPTGQTPAHAPQEIHSGPLIT